MAREILQLEEPPAGTRKNLSRPIYLVVGLGASALAAVWFASQGRAASAARDEEQQQVEELTPDHDVADTLASLALKQEAERERQRAAEQEGAHGEPPPATDALSVLRGRLPKASEVGEAPLDEAQAAAWASALSSADQAGGGAGTAAARLAEIRAQHEEQLLEQRLARQAEAEAPKTLTLDLGDTGAPKRLSEEQLETRENEEMGALSELSGQLLRQSAAQVKSANGLMSGGGLEALSGLGLGGALAGGVNDAAASNQGRHARQLDFFQRGGEQLATGYLMATVQKPLSPYELKSGTVIPGVLISAIDTDAGPGQVLGQVSQNVYDTASQDHLLIPQGSKVVGTYAGVELGQERVGVAAVKIVFPNADSLELGSMAMADATGKAGLKDRVNRHLLRRVGAVLLNTSATVGYQVTRPANPFGAEGAVHQALGESIIRMANEMAARDAQIPPTIEIRPGGRFVIMMNKDVVFPGAYEDGYPHRLRDVRRKAATSKGLISGKRS